MSKTETEQQAFVKAVPQKEHEWLNKLLGDWTYEMDCSMGTDQAPSKTTGFESVRSIGGLWVVAEGEIKSPDAEPALTMMTLGYDPNLKRYVGTWVGSMMTHMWIYNGELDASGKVLTLNSEGPDFYTPGKTAKYQDIIELKSDDKRTLSSQVLDANGKWQWFMTAHYQRKK